MTLSEILQQSTQRADCKGNYLSGCIHKLQNKMQAFENNAPTNAALLFGKSRKVKRGEMLFSYGQANKEFYFLLSGIARSFNNEKQKELTHNFFFPCVFIDNYIAMEDGNAADINIQMLKDGQVLVIDRELLNQMAQKYPELWEMQNLIFRTQASWQIARERKLKIWSKGELYQDLCSNYPYFIQQISQKLLATYFFMHEVTYCNIRKGL